MKKLIVIAVALLSFASCNWKAATEYRVHRKGAFSHRTYYSIAHSTVDARRGDNIVVDGVTWTVDGVNDILIVDGKEKVIF